MNQRESIAEASSQPLFDELRASEQRFRELADAIPQIVWVAAPDGALTHLNARASEYSGVQVHDLQGWSWERVIHPDDLPVTLQEWAIMLQSGIPKPLEFRIRRADGEYRWHITRQVPSRDASGQIRQWYGTCTDIEDQKRTEEALRSSEDRYRKLFHSIPDPMFVYDPIGFQYLAVNDAAVQKYGYSRAEFLRMSIMDIRPAEDVPALKQMLENSKPRYENRGLWRHRLRSGELIDVEVTAHSLELDGRPVCIALARDVTERRRAEAELRRTTELLRVVTEGTPDAVFVKDREGKYLLFNPAAARFVGRAAEEVLGKDDTAIFGPEDAAVIMEFDRRVMETDQVITNEEVLTAAGVTRTYLATKGPYRDGNGQIVGTIGISRDITERKQTEQLIAESQQRLQALFNNALNAILLTSDEGKYIDANPAACAMLGYEREELLQQAMKELLVEDQTPSIEERWFDFLRTGKQRGLVRLRRSDGQIITAEYSAVANVLPGLHLSVLSDVTERKQAEEAFRKISALHETIIQTAVEGICLCSPTADGREIRFSVWNERMTAITGYTRDEINDLGWFQTLFHDPQARERAQQQLAALVQGRGLHGEEWDIVRKDGDRRVLAVSTSIVESDDKTPLVVALMHDVTERRRNAEELALRQAELRHVSRVNTVGQMVVAISHEVAQPLAAISNYAASSEALLKAVQNGPTQLEKVRQHIEQISQQSRRAADIIARLREYSRKSAKQRIACDINELLQKSVEMLSLELRGGEVNIQWDLTPQLPPIFGDPVQLQQVFVNLLLNARDALLEQNAPARRIVLRSQLALGAIVIEVEDNGPGLTDEVAGRLYEPFVTTKPQGMGIGLSICRSILREHDGEIEYHPLPAGGTVFRLRMTLAKPQAK